MDYCLFDYKNGDFLQVLNLVLGKRKSSVQAEEGLRLRYLHNPFGKAIIACGLENGKTVVCIVIDQFQLFCHGKIRHCGLASVFSSKKACIPQDEVDGLLRLAEIEARNEGLDIIYAFEKQEELEKAKGSGWNWLRSNFQYRAIQIEPFRSLFRITDMAKPFVPETIVYSDLGKDVLSQQTDLAGAYFHVVSPVMSEGFLNWYCRIGDSRAVATVDSDKVGLLGYVGKRAGIKDFHLLNLFHGEEESLQHFQEGVIKTITANIKPDIITFEEGTHFLPEENTEYIKNLIGYGYRVLSGSGEDVEEMAVALYRWFGIW